MRAIEQIGHVKRSRQSLPYAYLRRVSDQLSGSLGGFTNEMADLNVEYSEVARDVDDSLEFIIAYAGAASPEARAEVEQFLDILHSARDQATDSIERYRGLAQTIDDLPPLQKNLVRTTRRASQQMRNMADNMEMTLSSINRAVTAGEEILSQHPSDRSTIP